MILSLLQLMLEYVNFLGLLKSAKKHDCVKSVVQRLESDATRMKKLTSEVSNLRHG